MPNSGGELIPSDWDRHKERVLDNLERLDRSVEKLGDKLDRLIWAMALSAFTSLMSIITGIAIAVYGGGGHK